MAWLSKQLSLESKKPLVSGYSREAYGLIPTDLIKTIRWYMDEVLYWSMKGKFLNKFVTKKTGQILYSSTYNYKDIEFCCYWYPNGNSINYQDQVIFGVTLSKLPQHIESLTIYYRLQCAAFDCLWKSVHTFDTVNTSNCIGWNPFNMKLSKCKNAKKIDFNCYINVLRIIYNDGQKKSIEESSECIARTAQITRYEWIVSIAKLYNCELGKTFYSENFGSGETESFCLFIAPKGFNQKQDAKTASNELEPLMLYLRILRLPINIKTMDMMYTIKATYVLIGNGNVVSVKEIKRTSVGYGFNECTKQCLYHEIPNVLLLSSLQIDIKIQIEQIIDMNDKIIAKCHWEKYGVIQDRKWTKIKKLFA